MLQGTLDIRTVALWLDHSNLATTEIYTRGMPIEDRDGIEALRPPHQHKGSFRPPDKLSALLGANRNGERDCPAVHVASDAGLANSPLIILPIRQLL
jgi:hypothetical protein